MRRPPSRLGRYDLVLPIARGGMGEVYLGRATGAGGFQRLIALKVVDAALEPDLARDLVEEAKLAARLHHPNVVAVLDVGLDGDITFLAMDYVEGASLAQLIGALRDADGALPVGIGLRVVLDLLEALHAAHELRDAAGLPLGVVHRDVSPANVLVGVDGVAKLADFGIARALSRSSRTTTGVIKGKFAYMAPEQARGLELDRRADIWAAGVVAWEVLARQPMHPLGNDPSTLLTLVSEDPPRLSTVADVGPEVERVVASVLERDPRARCASADAFARALESACAVEGLEIASRSEVAELVRRLCGDELDARRRAAERVPAEVAPPLALAPAGGPVALAAPLELTAPASEPVFDPGSYGPTTSMPIGSRPSRPWVRGLGAGAAVAVGAFLAFGAWHGAADPPALAAPGATGLARSTPSTAAQLAGASASASPVPAEPPPVVVDAVPAPSPAASSRAAASAGAAPAPPPRRPRAPSPGLVESDPYRRGR